MLIYNLITGISENRQTLQLYCEKKRFWIQQIPCPTGNKDDLENLIRTKLEELNSNVARIETGIIIVPNQNKLVPIHDGQFQYQHECAIPHSDDDMALICGFYSRASHFIQSEIDEKMLDIDRFNAINQALLHNYRTRHEDLLDDKLAGTPPSRIYRSFIFPRCKPNYSLDPLMKAANRTAAQIELALRQIRADEASYLRNVDKTLSTIRMTKPVAFLLDNVRSAFNVGSIFRTAETGAVSEVITVGITPHLPNPKIRKTAFSAVDVVFSRHFDNPVSAAEYFQTKGYKIIVLETTSRSQIYTNIEYPEKIVLVLGNELTGVDTRLLDLADYIIEIPTFGIKNSLNVASCAPIVLYEVLRQWGIKNTTKFK
jgi:tRNA G18 (ribose-2'-O)-methylase SpoU